MELLIPLLIFGAGLIFSGIKSTSESKKQAQREIDLSKLERPSGKAPLPKPQTNSQTRVGQETKKSRWQTLVDDFKEEYEKVEQQAKTTRTESKARDLSSKRLDQEIRSQVERSREISKREDRSKEKTRDQSLSVNGHLEIKTPKIHVENKQKPQVAFSAEDISFDEKAIVNGIIMNEILGPPKSKKRRR